MRQQGRSITVGDTVTVVRRVFVAPGALVQPRAPADSGVATLLGNPVVTREGDSVRIVYTLAVWAPGQSDLVLPGPVVIAMNGRVDTLAAAHVPLSVTSLLPSGQAPLKITPRAAHGWVPRADLTVLPFGILVPVALVAAALLHWVWRRRGRTAKKSAAVGAPLVDRERLERWIAAGEARLALEHLEALTRNREELAPWRARVDAVRFAPSGEPELTALVREGCDLAGWGTA